MSRHVERPPPNRCSLDEDHCLSLLDILVSFNAPISEEHAWALCYQCAKCFKNCMSNVQATPGQLNQCSVVTELGQVLIHRDGHVHPNTIFRGGGTPASPKPEDGSSTSPSEQTMVAGLGLVLFKALDFGLEEDEERHLNPELTRLIQNMTGSGSADRVQQCETDDEGIERDSGETEEDHQDHTHQISTLSRVLQECSVHLGGGGAQEAESHYRAVCRALVAEALELSSFLERVSHGTSVPTPPPHLTTTSPTTSSELASLNFNDWARLWVQVIRELRRGVQLKKVCYTRKPIEFELTPYEILMEDIRARRYQLKKVMVDGNIPHRVKKDAHAVILEFIRSRPPLRKASERKLAPLTSKPSTPRERLLESIKQGHAKLRTPPLNTKSRLVDPPPVQPPTSNKSTRRLIKVDFSALPMDDEEDDEDMEEEGRAEKEVTGDDGVDGTGAGAGADRTIHELEGGPPSNRWQRTGSRLSQAEIHEYFDSALQSYDLATQCPWAGRGCSRRRHTVVVCQTGTKGSLSQPQSRPHSRQTDTPGSEESIATTLPEMTWSRSSLQDDLLHSKQWQEECLSLTLEEIVHIRSVLTKAELESLPVEGHVKEDAEKRKVCFLCMKTRFGIFGPWGQVCKLCKRTVCTKCCSKMRIPTEHFSHVPVVALSPNLLSPCDSEDSFPKALVNKLMSSGGGHEQGPRAGVGSAPNSPKLNRSAPPSQMSASLISDGPISLPSSSPAYTPSDKWRMAREKALGRRGRDKAEKLKGLQMTVCHDCKTMVLQIIKSSRTTRNNAIRNLTLDLSPVY